jgi:cell wall-associated NlpC family hydrolase
MLTRRRTLSLAFTMMVAVAASGLAACYPLDATPGEKAVLAAREEIGQPYVTGGESEKEGGFDCSGLTYYAWNQAAGIKIPRSSAAQYAWARPIHKASLRAGDFVFYSSSGPTGTVSHVALYSGDGMIIQAHKPGTPLDEIKMDGYWTGHLVGYGRVPTDALPS